MPVRASAGAYPNGSLAVLLNRIGATFCAAGTAARDRAHGRAGGDAEFNAVAQRGPWDLRAGRRPAAAAAPRDDARRDPPRPGDRRVPDPPGSPRPRCGRRSTGSSFGGAVGIEASPAGSGCRFAARRPRPRPARVTGGYALADLVASANPARWRSPLGRGPSRPTTPTRHRGPPELPLHEGGERRHGARRPGRVRLFELTTLAATEVTAACLGVAGARARRVGRRRGPVRPRRPRLRRTRLRPRRRHRRGRSTRRRRWGRSTSGTVRARPLRRRHPRAGGRMIRRPARAARRHSNQAIDAVSSAAAASASVSAHSRRRCRRQDPRGTGLDPLGVDQRRRSDANAEHEDRRLDPGAAAGAVTHHSPLLESSSAADSLSNLSSQSRTALPSPPPRRRPATAHRRSAGPSAP